MYNLWHNLQHVEGGQYLVQVEVEYPIWNLNSCGYLKKKSEFSNSSHFYVPATKWPGHIGYPCP